MSKFTIRITPDAEKDIKKLYRSGDKASIKKFEAIFEELKEHPTTGRGNPEQLKYQLSDYWSREINKKDRLVYLIEEEPNRAVLVVSALGHYGDK